MNLLSRRSVLAIAAVVDVALHCRSAPVAAKALAARHRLPPRHLETLLQGLVHAKILKGVRGPRGGYELARERRRITVGEIVRTAMSLSTADPEDLGANSVLLERVIDPASQRPGRPSAQARKASTSISFFAGFDMRDILVARVTELVVFFVAGAKCRHAFAQRNMLRLLS
jgi:Rrf2 family iron-sulfur cluster assembly transcriptional regulator